MRTLPLAFALILALSLSSCSKKKADTAAPLPPAKPALVQLEKIPFTAPADSIISPEKMRAWLNCNGLLDTLAMSYIDSFKTEEPSKRLDYQKNFAIEQDNICIRAGLKSGYVEYTWILRSSGSSKNRALLDSLTTGSY